MFTGIVEEVGSLKAIRNSGESAVLQISASKVLEDVKLGDSIAVNGVCLTVTNFGSDFFEADVMHETVDRSGFSKMRPGSPVNLERAMAANSRFGGHIVAGHVDGQGKIVAIEKDENAIWFTIECDKSILKYIVEKGSIAIDGISLTVAKVSDRNFAISAIPHSLANTNLSQKRLGDFVNLENDVIGKYVEKLLFHKEEEEKRESGVTQEFLIRCGF